MAITASQVGTANTLEQFRVQFNNLQTDVSGLESGTISYTALSATTISVSELTVTSSLSAESFIFEGDTDDDFETTLTVTDPTADRTITLPNLTGTVSLITATETLTNKTMTTPTLTTPVINAGAQLKNGATSAGFAEFFEDSDNGTNKVTLIGPASTADVTLTLPAETGTVLSTGTTANTLITGQTSITSGDVASGSDELLISDASASTFKRVTVDNLISSAGGLTSVAADSSPQLGANLDTNSFNILIDDAHFIADENGNEQIIFQTTSSAVNQIDITNAATGSGPSIVATGGDTNIDLTLNPKGSGTVNIDSNVEVSDGLIELKTGTGNVAKIKFYCESGNAHAQTLQASPHSAGSSAVVVLPEASGNLIGTGDTGTLPLAAIDIDGGTDIGAALTTSDLIIVDDGAGGTNRKSTLARMITLVQANIDDPTALSIALG
tara:strand:+ start:271 stop:1593 length:1323 start_codon:yes stop_codon:yes gene_type:complete